MIFVVFLLTMELNKNWIEEHKNSIIEGDCLDLMKQIDDKSVDILGGSYPNSAIDDGKSMKVFASYTVDQNVQNLTFSPLGGYALTQTGAYFASYDLEHQSFSASNIDGSGAVAQLKWLDDNYVWSDRDGNLVIHEFDGTNSHTINQVLVGQDVALTHNEKYIYSLNQSGTGYQLQRVLMILP